MPQKGTKIEYLGGVEIRSGKLTAQHTAAPRDSAKIKYIVLHYAGVPGLSAQRLCERFVATTQAKSTHYTVDEDEVWRVCADEYAAWHCGLKAGANYKHPKARNDNALGVDLCERRVAATSGSVYAADWYFPAETIARAVELVAALCCRYNLDPRDAVLRHYDVTGKICPAPWAGNVISSVTGQRREEDWRDFKRAVVERAQSMSEDGAQK